MLPGRSPLPLLGTVAVLAVVIAVDKYIVAPFRLRMRSRQSTETRIELADEEPVPPAVDAELAPQVASLERAGFRALPLCRGAVEPAPHGSAWFIRVLEHPLNGDAAKVMVTAQDAGQARPYSLTVFETKLATGGAVRTSNAPLPGATPPPAGDRVARFPRVRDAARLYALHRAHVRRVGRATRRVRISDPVAYQLREEAIGHQRMVGSGYYEVADGAVRPTWRGAFLSTWRFLPPWRTWLEARDERLRRELESGVHAA